MHLRLKLPTSLAVTLVCSCHAAGHPVTDALGDGTVTPIADARQADASGDAPIIPADAGIDAVLADAAMPDAAVADAPPDAMPDADLA